MYRWLVLTRRLTPPHRTSVAVGIGLVAALLGAAPRDAESDSVQAFRHPLLDLPAMDRPVATLPPEVAGALARGLAAMGASPETARYDTRTRRLTSLVLSEPLVPGTGSRNLLRRAESSPSEAALEEEAWRALRRYLERNCIPLRIDVSQLGTPRVTIADRGEVIQIFVPRIVGGVAVRGSALLATINHGNLVLLGMQTWGDVPEATAALFTAEAAREAVRRRIFPLRMEGLERRPRLELVAVDGGDLLLYRPVWVFGAAEWEALVDAENGDVLALEPERSSAVSRLSAEAAHIGTPEKRSLALASPDASSYRRIFGGVYPFSNDQVGPEGTEQPGTPMPFADAFGGGYTGFCDQGGNATCLQGTLRTTLSGRYVRIVDGCGAISEGSVGDLDLGSGPAATDTDCTVPAGHSAGDTKAARSAYFGLNQIIAQARSFFPNVGWLQTPLTVHVNLTGGCNAYWDSETLNFARSGGGGPCGNTGEIVSLVDQIWATALDQKVGNPTVSRPRDGFADSLSMLFSNKSCVARGFTPGSNCADYGDPCVACTGLRDVDFAKSTSGLPHDLTWIASACPSGSLAGPCGRTGFCESQIVGEALWDLARRDLPAAGLDASTALAVTTRLFYIGGSIVSDWYECTAPAGGCPASGGYMSFLAADDDDGDLSNGTPHMAAIFAAFNRHQIACATPTVLNGGCAGAPAAAPTLTVTAVDQGARLSWTSVPGASSYAVYRSEAVGVDACNTGKIRVGQSAGTAFEDLGLQNGRPYRYTVQAIGTGAACAGPMSACQAVTPAPGTNLAIPGAASVSIAGGDGDEFLDNCETATIRFDVVSTGTSPLTNVRIQSAASPTHPSLIFPTFPIPVADSLPSCEVATASVGFFATGLSFGDTVDLEITVTSDELFPSVRTVPVRILNAETDTAPVASRTYGFDTDGDLEGWSIVRGTWTQAAVGGSGTPRYLRSSSLLDNQCDEIRSPLLRLTASSTLTLQTRFDIEDFDGIDWYDRANVAVFDPNTGVRTTVLPIGGRLYTASGPNGACVTKGQNGWAGHFFTTWAASTWNAAALNPGLAFSGRVTGIDIAYGTDSGASFDGFRFDDVVLTNFEELVPDAQTNTCALQSASPVSIAVDPSGNGVLQPAETALIRPTWVNSGTTPFFLTGALSSFTGPATATYSIPDAAGSYGTLGIASSAACSDCYTVRVDATTRPLQHWDATVLETPSAGAPKTWTLHIGDSFADVPSTGPFFRFVETIFHNSVTAGCGGANYCPSSPTTRQQMAVFVLVAKDGAGVAPPVCGTPIFSDVPASSPYCRWIEELSRRGVVAGCGGGNYCPTSAVSRQEMAVFALATEEGSGFAPPACGTPLFNDVPASSPFCRWIEELARRGVVAGCGGGSYCPTAPVTRQQMSVFLTQTFGLALYGP